MFPELGGLRLTKFEPYLNVSSVHKGQAWNKERNKTYLLYSSR